MYCSGAFKKGHQTVVLPLVATHGGHIQDAAGDGILAEFGSVQQANAEGLALGSLHKGGKL
jgi:class 3 adenylate cyclase